MSNYDWNEGRKQAEKGSGLEPQKPGESAQSFKERSAGYDHGKNQKS